MRPETEVLEYLILKMMAEKKEILEALYAYLSGRLSLSQASYLYNISKFQLRGYAQRLRQKGADNYTYKVISLKAIPIITSIVRPVAAKNNHRYICTICSYKANYLTIENHIKNRHYSKVLEELKRVISALRALNHPS